VRQLEIAQMTGSKKLARVIVVSIALAAPSIVLGTVYGIGAAIAAQIVTEDQARDIALKALPGKVTDLTIERKNGQDVYVVEIVSDKNGAETDVLVDPHSGQVLGME
jgi:uncharacterized membrane protein YkoI